MDLIVEHRMFRLNDKRHPGGCQLFHRLNFRFELNRPHDEIERPILKILFLYTTD